MSNEENKKENYQEEFMNDDKFIKAKNEWISQEHEKPKSKEKFLSDCLIKKSDKFEKNTQKIIKNLSKFETSSNGDLFKKIKSDLFVFFNIHYKEYFEEPNEYK